MDTSSFIEAPPIPYQRRYRADIRQSDSTRTMVKDPASEAVKFRRNLHHPEQPSTHKQTAPSRSGTAIGNDCDSEYFAMAGNQVGKATDLGTAYPMSDVVEGTVEQDSKPARSMKKHSS